MDTISIVETEQDKTYVQTPVKIDKFALQKLLNSKPPPLPDLPTVTVRCDRETDSWVVEMDGAVSNEPCAVLMDVTFSHKYESIGCGGEYSGTAKGLKLPSAQPVKADKVTVKKLYFDPFEGGFFIKGTGEKLLRADYLILKPGCHSEVVMAPEVAK